MNFKTLIAAAVLATAVAPSYAAFNMVENESFDSSKNIKADWTAWTFSSQAFKVKDDSNVQLDFSFTPGKNNSGFVYGLIIDLLQGNQLLESQPFSGGADQFVFTNNFDPNKNYKFRFTGYSSDFKGKLNFEAKAVAPVPEPETYALMGMGLVGLFAARRRKAKQAA